MANTPSTSFRLSAQTLTNLDRIAQFFSVKTLADLDRIAQFQTDVVSETIGRPSRAWNRTMALEYAISRAVDELEPGRHDHGG